MQRLFFLFLFFSALNACAQNTNTNTNVNNTNKGNSYNIIIPVNDSVVKPMPASDEDMELEEISVKKKATPSPKLHKESEKAAPAFQSTEGLTKEESIDSPAVPAAAQMQMQFESNQSSSNSQYNRRSASPTEQTKMDASVEYYKNESPNSFLTHFYAYLAGHYNTDLYPELQAAATLNPESVEVKKQLAAYNIITNNAEVAVPIIQELINEDVVSTGQLIYANDLLLSGDAESIVVLHGFEDMFATYYVQNANSVRPDVKLMSLDFMQSATYRAGWVENNLVLPETEVVDTAYLKALCHLNLAQTFQLSMTIPKDYFVGMKSNLYPVGLTLRYAELPYDNYNSNYQLWSQDIDFAIVETPTDDSGDDWCGNYLPMLVTLKKQLAKLGREEEIEKINQVILKIGARSGNTDQVKKYVK